MRVRYDPQVDALRVTTGMPQAVSESLWDPEYDNIVVDLAHEDKLDIVGLDILWISAYLPLGKRGYDSETDTLLMGRTTTDPKLIIENGDIVGHWEIDVDDPDERPNPVGVVIKRASLHLGKIMPERPVAKTLS